MGLYIPGVTDREFATICAGCEFPFSDDECYRALRPEAAAYEDKSEDDGDREWYLYFSDCPNCGSNRRAQLDVGPRCEVYVIPANRSSTTTTENGT